MSDVLAEVDYEPLDPGLRDSLERTMLAFSGILEDLLEAGNEAFLDDASAYVWRWAIMFAVVLRDLGRSAILLMDDGSHSRAAIMLRRVAFEYRTRFHYYWTHPEDAVVAMDDFDGESKKFEQRVGPESVTFIRDPGFDFERFRNAKAAFPNFLDICKVVYGGDGEYNYATFYSYPSFLLHGASMMSMDVLKRVDGHWTIHLDSGRPFTNEIAGNLGVFLLDFAGDVVRAFQLEGRVLVDEIGAEFNVKRKALGLL